MQLTSDGEGGPEALPFQVLIVLELRDKEKNGSMEGERQHEVFGGPGNPLFLEGPTTNGRRLMPADKQTPAQSSVRLTDVFHGGTGPHRGLELSEKEDTASCARHDRDIFTFR